MFGSDHHISFFVIRIELFEPFVPITLISQSLFFLGTPVWNLGNLQTHHKSILVTISLKLKLTGLVNLLRRTVGTSWEIEITTWGARKARRWITGNSLPGLDQCAARKTAQISR